MTLRTRSTLAFVLAALAAGCGSTSLKSRIVLAQPTSVAVFSGITSKNPGVLHPYAAIANGARDDLVLVDALDDKPVLAPIVVRALAIPTLTRPTFVVAGSLHDGGADLLAVIPQGTGIIQVVRTWTEVNQVVDGLQIDLAPLAPGAEVLSVISSPVPTAGTGEPAEGKVRLVLGLTGGRLAVVEYARDVDGEAIAAAPAIEVRSVGFEPVALSTTPGDARLLYAATPDDLPAGSGRYGVVEIGAAAALPSWTFDLLPTVAPTRLVAAVRVAERIWAENDEEIPEESPYVLRVFAALDPIGCNDDGAIPCGIVTVDPSPGVRGIVPDPLGELPWQPPVRLAAEPIAMLAVIPPSKQPEGLSAGRFNIQTGLGVREATGAVGVIEANGRVYTLDAGRRTIHNDNTMLRTLEGTTSQTRTRASGILFVARESPKPPTTQILQLVVCTTITEAGGKPECKLDSSGDAVDGIRVTPGYTRDDTFDVSWQGVLPAISARSVDVGVEGGQLYAAAQLRTAAGIAEAARLYDPALGIHPGDTFELNVRDLSEGDDACDVADDPATTIVESEVDTHEFTIASILPPDPARFPGGALLLADDGSACYAALKAGHAGMIGSVRASGWLMKSSLLGYAGRPVVLASVERENLNDEVVPPAPHTTGLDFRVLAELRYADETALSCPLSPWPADPASVSCDAACRERCERLSLSRKARRWYTLPDACGDDATCTAQWGGPIIDPDPDNDPVTDNPEISGNSTSPPNATGPVVSFRFTVRQRFSSTSVKVIYPKIVNRDAGVKVTTVSGHTPTARYPLSGAIVMPTGMAAFDQSPWNLTGSYRFWVSYTDDAVMDFSPSQTINTPVSVR